MTGRSFDQEAWEERWAQVLRDHADVVAARPPNHHLVGLTADLAPGVALDAGCGHGSEALWLAGRGWRVEAVDFSASALAQARASAEALGDDVAGRTEWVQGDLTTWLPEPGRYDLVSCLYVNALDSVEALVVRLAGGVAPGGALLLVGHRPVDPATGAPTAAADQEQVSVQAALAVLDTEDWRVDVAEERRRQVEGTGVDAVVLARRTSGSG